MKVAVIGGGFMGLTLATKLAHQGAQLTIFEKDEQVGGLATHEDYGTFSWDRFYHVILPGDAFLLDVIKEAGLEPALRWGETRTGYYVNQKFYSVSSSLEFLLFPPLGLWSKFRLALTILRASRIQDWQRMESMTVEDWLVKVGGRKTFEKFWKPLLLAKLGENYRRVSAVFIWTYIKRLFEARGDDSAKKEQMGYLSGGYKTLFDRMMERLTAQGHRIALGTTVERIEANPSGGITLTANGASSHFDKVVFTSPVNVLEKVADKALFHLEGDTHGVEYLGVICMILNTKVPLTDFYVLNLADDRIPFTGVIGMTTLVDQQETGGYHMTYFPKYILSTDELLRKPETEIKETFLAGVKRLYPSLKDEDIVSVHINRAFKVQPLQVLNYSQIVPKVKTQHPDFYILNTSQFVNDTLNNNSVARHVSRFMEEHGPAFVTGKPETVNA